MRSILNLIRRPNRGLALVLCLVTFAESAFGFAPPETLDIRTPGLYLARRDHPGFATTETPLAPLDIDDIESYLRDHPELKDHRVVLGIPSLLKGKDVVESVKRALIELELKPDVELIRWPNGTWHEGFLDFFPRRQDWQAPLPEENVRATVMVFGGEALSISMVVYLVLIKKLRPAIGALTTALDLSQQAIFAYPMRFFSNYQRRQHWAKQYLFNIIVGAFFSSNFWPLFNYDTLTHAPSVWPLFADYLNTVAVGAVISSVWGFVGVVVFRWEGSKENRLDLNAKRIFRSNVLLIQQMLLSPFYIYSMAPFASPLFTAQAFGHTFLDVNIGHIVVFGAGLASAAILPYVDRIAARISDWAEEDGRRGRCVRFLKGDKLKRSDTDSVKTAFSR